MFAGPAAEHHDWKPQKRAAIGFAPLTILMQVSGQNRSYANPTIEAALIMYSSALGTHTRKPMRRCKVRALHSTSLSTVFGSVTTLVWWWT
ncbi:hypothetical protein AXW67_35000 [Bradyrhizobium neotropicale]|uniref:Uncharacterized protein n=1 Tax=Bradyrhizobium neotropicale TaxID=1497615 RepID=A0A176ZH54_9BRAD|nr:hypothetical protein AXW67_35000 [Bradyrhizobium neotropicale]